MCDINKNLSLKGNIAVLLVICCCCLSAQGKYGGGTGEPNHPYLIFDANQMNAIGADSNDWDKHFKLMADIDLSCYAGTSFNIIGYFVDWGDNQPFTGVFDGNAHKISNFTYTSTDKRYIGLFGYIDGGEIKNLVLIAPNIETGTGWDVGSLAGYLKDGTITNCQVEGGNIKGDHYVGSLAGSNYGYFSNCYSTGNVSGDYDVGGLVGFNNGIISGCYSTAYVRGVGDVGGLVGTNLRDVSNSYFTGNVSGDYHVGGLVGHNHLMDVHHGSVSNCYSNGNLSGQNEVGGLVGCNEDGYVSNCYSICDVNGIGYVGGLVGLNVGSIRNSFWNSDTQTHGVTESIGLNEGNVTNVTGLPTTKMQTISTFTEAGWDFIKERGNGTADNWQMPADGGYPILSFFHIDIPFPLAGSGIASEPYLITSANELGMVNWYPADCCFKLTEDIDLSGIHWSVAVVPIFNGCFDGDGHRVLNMQISGGGYLGLFGFLRDQGRISNLDLVGNSVNGDRYVGGLVGDNYYGIVSNCCSIGYVSGTGSFVGGLMGLNSGCGIVANCYSSGNVNGYEDIGGLVGENWGSVSNCYSTAKVTGGGCVGGLVGNNIGADTVLNCYATGNVNGRWNVGGLVGYNYYGSVSNCYSTGDLNGMGDNLGGLVGWNEGGRISNCYSASDVSSSGDCTGGLVGKNRFGRVFDCYSTGFVNGWEYDGGLVGVNNQGGVSRSFWDVQTSGMSYSAGGTGLPTAEMQMQVTFTDAGWDFNTPVWTIDDGKDYPRLWWEFVPVLHAEPEVTLGTSNRISWEHIICDIEYYAECAGVANFTIILYNSGWITETSCEFTGLELGQRYWYSVKARNAAGKESSWSNVEFSLQGTLADAVDIMLAPESLKNENMKKTLLNKIDEVLEMIDESLYENALSKLENDILQKTNGCAEMGEPDKNDWIISCEAQSEIYPLVIETIEYINSLMEQFPD